MAGDVPSLGSRLDSARAKLRRADQHLRALKNSLDRLGKREFYRPGAKAYDPGFGGFLPSREEIVAVTRTALGVHLPRPYVTKRMFFSTIPLTITLTPVGDYSTQYLRWGVLVGEVVHSIGSALDNLIWELAQPLPAFPLGASSKARATYTRHLNNLGFPYTKERRDWANSCGRYLHFVTDASVRAVLEEAQAFFAWEKQGTDPDTFPLEIVHELWNRDKHRTVNVGAAGLQFQVTTVRMPDFFPGVDNLASEIIEVFPIRPIEGETEMARLLVHFPQEIEFPSAPTYELNMLVQPKFTLAILFGQGSPGEGLNALDRLRRACYLASQIIDKFS